MHFYRKKRKYNLGSNKIISSWYSFALPSDLEKDLSSCLTEICHISDLVAGWVSVVLAIHLPVTDRSPPTPVVLSPDHSTLINSSHLVIKLSKGSPVCLCSCVPLHLSITEKLLHYNKDFSCGTSSSGKQNKNKNKLICFPSIHQGQTLHAYPTLWGTDNQCTSGL